LPPFEHRRPELCAETFRLLRDLVHGHCGILVREEMKYVMERRLWPRLEALGLADFDGYYRHLRYDPNRRAELESAVEALTTNETYFFREPQQLRAFSRELLPLLHQRNGRERRLRIWSAGCSSGEEPYTVAMLIEASGLFVGWDVEVYGTDISRRVLALARRAEYGTSALRATLPEHVERFFEPVGNQRVRVREEIRAQVSFGQLNLVDPSSAQLVAPMDLVFCRNVMIYFDPPIRRRVVRLFYEKLRPGGFLLLGHAESLISLSSEFELVHLQDDLVYRRPPENAAREGHG
jgi:chemotaxis protein methyltransferase CheR